jgi:hypothetical protein
MHSGEAMTNYALNLSSNLGASESIVMREQDALAWSDYERGVALECKWGFRGAARARDRLTAPARSGIWWDANAALSAMTRMCGRIFMSNRAVDRASRVKQGAPPTLGT